MIEVAYAAVEVTGQDGAQTLKSALNIVEVNRVNGEPGHYACYFVEPMTQAVYTVAVGLNAGDATHRHIGYNRVSQHRCDVWILDNGVPTGLDVDFTIRVEAVS